MVKLRLTSVDIRALVADIKQRFLGLRLANVYDINAKTYSFKFARPDGKAFLLIESGIRMHSTEFDRNKNDIPSLFAMKHLRTKRLESIEQLGVDRVVMLTFGSGPAVNHLIVEFYANGNMILTDPAFEILTLLRTHKYDDGTLIAVHQKYPTNTAKQFTPMSEDSLKAMLQEGAEKKETLKQLLNRRLDFGPALVEHTLLSSALNPSLVVTETLDVALISSLRSAILEGEKLFDPNAPRKGYIILADKAKVAQPKKQKKVKPPRTKGGKPPKAGEASAVGAVPAAAEVKKEEEKEEKEEKEEDKEEDKEEIAAVGGKEGVAKGEQSDLFDEFHPFLFAQFATRQTLEFPSFDKALDEFFSKIETQRSTTAQKEQEDAVHAKLEKVKTDQSRRVQQLQANIDSHEFKARLIEQNLADVDMAIQIIRSYVGQSTDWEELRALVKEEKKKGNPIAMIIQHLKLDSNEITLLLHEVRESDTDDEVVEKAYQVDVELSLTAYANARKYYEDKKKAAEKKVKTISMTDQAYKAAEKKTLSQMKETKTKAAIQSLRKVYWFEKFHWFFSSENYIVISGKDAQQNEMLVKRYMRKGDLYVHADLHGASSCIIKNPSQQPVPPLTLSQAGCMTVCRSAAWSAKVVTSAYWVHEHQVSKTAPTGEYLVTGSFMIRGKKNFLPPVPLVMGWGLIFKLDDASAARHAGERAVRPAGEEEIETLDATKYGLAPLAAVATSESPAAQPKEEEKHMRRFERKALRKQQKEDGTEEAGGSGADTAGEEAEKIESIEDVAQKPAKGAAKKATTKEDVAAPTAAFAKMKLVSQDEESGEDEVDATGKANPRLSVAQRRKLKKGGAAGADGKPAAAVHALTPAKSKAAPVVATAKAAPKGEKQALVPRGKKGKMKKMKEKYGEQDEEDRKLALKLLGSAGPAAESSDEEEEKQPTAPPPAAVNPKLPVEVVGEAKSKEEKKDEVESIDPAEREAARLARKERKVAQQKEQEEVNKILTEENVIAAADEHMKESIEINSLTGVPRSDDVLLFCMSVSAPYTAMQNFKYKVKLTPGNLKKGKAAKQALEVFMRAAEGREKDLIKAVPDPECMATMMAEVKVSTPGLFGGAKKKKGGGGGAGKGLKSSTTDE